MNLESYPQPVAQLLKRDYEHSYQVDEWPDYVTELELTEDHSPELIRMALDPEFDELDQDDAAVWAPLHAIRALGQLKSEAAIAPLITLFDRTDDDYLRETVPGAFSLIGSVAIAPLEAVLQDKSQDFWARVLAITCLEKISRDLGRPNHPSQRKHRRKRRRKNANAPKLTQGKTR